ncbi:beta-N-acetylhexosaminidase [Williamwhitmania taraxaci]|uniref:Hexosaminidase n=1 Tax=Williamwhitmania taraxaci TaxID=1640674 RepID=A0A1G6NN63_9BACT|nr:family 20 glycosylhydrolase [Williamwhitmania taraxaci]SDC68814.1 hexosaminidase [Williamwhitmania taraxaci]
MKKLLPLFAAILISANLSATNTLNLMPYPSEVKFGVGKFTVDKSLRISIQGQYNNRLTPNVGRFVQRLSKRTTITLDRDTIITGKPNATFTIAVNRSGIVKLGEDESYRLIIDSSRISLTAETELGAMHGLETILQLLDRNEKEFFLPAIEINDQPRFAWRGLMIDAGRHFIPVDIVKHNIDGMAMVKLNVLHWHLSEDQGFRIECKTFPKLHEMGSNGEYYTQQEVKEVIAYAAERGIRVMPEFDIPGHAAAWMVGYPKLSSGTDTNRIEKYFGGFRPTLNPTERYTYRFLKKFFKEMCALFPDDYMHIGGDENNGLQWNENPKIQAFMKKNGIKNNNELQVYFNAKVLDIITKNGKKMMGWDEIFQPNLPKNIVIHSWRGREYMEQAAKKGYQSVLSAGFYIDLFRPASYHYLNDPLPADTILTDAERRLILGGEATMWAELTNYETEDMRIWPRTAAIAERLWSPSGINDVDDMYRRLNIISIQLEETGLTHIKNREMMMRRLCNSYDVEPLRILLDAVEPREGYKRHGSKPRYNTESPLSRAVDIALPDAPDAIRFRLTLKDYLQIKSQNSYLTLTEMLNQWALCYGRVSNLAANNVALQELLPLASNLTQIANIAQPLLPMIQSGKTITAEEADAIKTQVKELAKPVGELEVAIGESVGMIVDALVMK